MPHPAAAAAAAALQELVKSNNNGYRGSQRLHGNIGELLQFGPPWDTNGGWVGRVQGGGGQDLGGAENLDGLPSISTGVPQSHPVPPSLPQTASASVAASL